MDLINGISPQFGFISDILQNISDITFKNFLISLT